MRLDQKLAVEHQTTLEPTLPNSPYQKQPVIHAGDLQDNSQNYEHSSQQDNKQGISHSSEDAQKKPQADQKTSKRYY